MTNEKLTHPQYTTAWGLARAFGHEWARAPYDHVRLDGPTVEEIAATTRKNSVVAGLDMDGIQGIQAPSWSSSPAFEGASYLEHVTGSGRLRWFIAPNGGWIFNVERAGGPEAKGPEVVLVAAETESGLCVRVVVPSRVEERHWSALADAVRAVATPGWWREHPELVAAERRHRAYQAAATIAPGDPMSVYACCLAAAQKAAL